ncbi:MAG: helix-turn-helix transcriptional regulator [Chloroflexota bacterium]|nr:helix-turn-helix transcriptional regulator [Chloroflexota bacterium]
MLFGKTISQARKNKNLSLKELAALVRKEDGDSISIQYLNDIEHGRRNPPSDFLIQQLAAVLDIDVELLYFRAGEFPVPEDLRDRPISGDKVREAYRAFRKSLEESE